MPKRIMPLTDMKIVKAKKQKKSHTMFDTGQFYLFLTQLAKYATELIHG